MEEISVECSFVVKMRNMQKWIWNSVIDVLAFAVKTLRSVCTLYVESLWINVEKLDTPSYQFNELDQTAP